MPEARISLDMFPATVRMEDGTRYPVARVTLSDGRARVWVLASGSSEPTAAVDAPYLSFEGNRLKGFAVLTEGGTIRVDRNPGCGCGHKRLKSFDPYGGATRLFVGKD